MKAPEISKPGIDFLGHKITEFSSDLAINNNEVTGSLNKISDSTNSLDGYYLPIAIKDPIDGAVYSVEAKDSASSKLQTISEDASHFLIKLTDPTKDIITVTIVKNKVSKSTNLVISSLTLNAG